MRLKVEACGICGSDLHFWHGQLPRPIGTAPGHEFAGTVIDGPARLPDVRYAVSPNVCCGRCDFCREQHVNSFVTAANCASPTLTGVNVDGAHAEYTVAHASGTVLLPRDISYENAAPTLCAGYTVWAAIRRAAPKPGGHIAVVGIGGLGHFAIQYAKAAGFAVTAVTRTSSKAELARKLGADNVVSDGAELKAAGGADVIMHTSSSHAAVVNAMEGLRPWGKVIMNGIALDEMTLPALPLVSHSYEIVGSAHNSLEYLAEALELVASGAVKPMIEVFPKERVADAYERAASGAVRFKAVMTY